MIDWRLIWGNKAEYAVSNERERQVAALGFLQEWVKAIVALETAAIAVIGAFVTAGKVPELELWPFWFLVATVLLLSIGIFFGVTLLHMLPGAAQRVPKWGETEDAMEAYKAAKEYDIYFIKTHGNRPILFWSVLFYLFFILGLICFLIFQGFQMWPLKASAAQLSEATDSWVGEDLNLRLLGERARSAFADP